ncbi:effector-associated constant component EACC1 [Streptomyces cyanogenus]|uniref:Uncharacterized protein n=1 Tax=Streptomyces cyanogenus TaxID=80860 RepID=A0ABX7TM64_STRCY|nr:hypothetical protein [Streptomyces cyanogenus]QTD97835.1 hypothetical protein S1361_10800 [Streptomyces cyanogenus]
MIRISAEGEDAEEELRSLRSWLLDEPEIRQHAVISWGAQALTKEEMGTGIDVLQLVTDNGWSAVAFAMAYRDWRRTRRSAAVVTIEHNGVTVSVNGADDQAVARITRALSQE